MEIKYWIELRKTRGKNRLLNFTLPFLHNLEYIYNI